MEAILQDWNNKCRLIDYNIRIDETWAHSLLFADDQKITTIIRGNVHMSTKQTETISSNRKT